MNGGHYTVTLYATKSRGLQLVAPHCSYLEVPASEKILDLEQPAHLSPTLDALGILGVCQVSHDINKIGGETLEKASPIKSPDNSCIDRAQGTD